MHGPTLIMVPTIAVTTFLLACAMFAATATSPPSPIHTRIVFLGDSNTRGTPHVSRGVPEFDGDPNPIADVWQDSLYDGPGAGARSAYVNLLRQRLGRGYLLHNRGRGGTRALEWADNLQGILGEVERLEPEVVVLYVGLSGIVLAEAPHDFEAAIPRLVAAARSWPSVRHVLLVKVPPVAAAAPEGTAARIAAYNQWLAGWAAGRRDVALVDIHATLADDDGHLRPRFADGPDLYHQNYNGHYEVAQCLFDAFLDTGVLRPGGRRSRTDR